MKWRRINLFGRPGIGKSTSAARIYSDMKSFDYKVEYVNEYVKSWAYMGRPIRSFDQVYIFGKQMNSEDKLLFHSNLDYIISDSPILIQCAYAKLANDPVHEPLLQLVKMFDQKFKPLNIFLDCPPLNHQNEGRFHNLDQSLAAAKLMREMLIEEYSEFITWDARDHVGLSQYVLSLLRPLAQDQHQVAT